MKIRKIAAIISAAALALALTGCGRGEGGMFIENGVLESVVSDLTEASIPDRVTEISDWAFYGCTSLESVNIPNSVTEMGAHAFSDCTSLTSINIPDSVTKISYSFGDCENIKATYKGKTYDYEHIEALYKAINGN